MKLKPYLCTVVQHYDEADSAWVLKPVWVLAKDTESAKRKAFRDLPSDVDLDRVEVAVVNPFQ